MNAANQVAILAVQKDGYSGNAYQQVAIELQERLTLTEAALQRMTDLVRFQRSELHSEGLITDAEYAALVADSEGGERVNRLSGYDDMRSTLRNTEAAYTSLFERHEALQRENAHLIDTMVQVVPDVDAEMIERTAQIAAHRVCCGSEHDPAQGKLHGYCIVCGVAWPCEYAGAPPKAEGA